MIWIRAESCTFTDAFFWLCPKSVLRIKEDVLNQYKNVTFWERKKKLLFDPSLQCSIKIGQVWLCFFFFWLLGMLKHKIRQKFTQPVCACLLHHEREPIWKEYAFLKCNYRNRFWLYAISVLMELCLSLRKQMLDSWLVSSWLWFWRPGQTHSKSSRVYVLYKIQKLGRKRLFRLYVTNQFKLQTDFKWVE